MLLDNGAVKITPDQTSRKNSIAGLSHFLANPFFGGNTIGERSPDDYSPWKFNVSNFQHKKENYNFYNLAGDKIN